MEKNPKSESYIIKEAENVIENYLKTRENKENNLLKEKYERLKITSIAMGIVGLIGIFDLTMQSKSLQSTLFTPEPILFAGVVYYANVKLFSVIAKLLENRLNRHD